MGNQSGNASTQHEQCPNAEVPSWARPIVTACDLICPYFLMLAGLAFVMLCAMIGIKRVDLPWLLNIIGAFGFFYSIGLLGLLVAQYRSLWTAWITFALGFGLFFAPLLLAIVTVHLGMSAENTFILKFSGTCKNLGIFTVIVSVIALMAGFVRALLIREEKRRATRFQYAVTATKTVEKPGLFPKCWQMSRCRPGVRMSCPNYVDHVTCWRRRSGCFCDRSLANFLIESSGKGEAQEAVEMQQATRVQHSITAAREHMKGMRRRPWKEQRKMCLSCPIYIEHQEYKYRHFSWLCVPLTLGITVGAYQFFDMGYDISVKYLDEVLAKTVKIPGIHLSSSLAHSPFEYLLLGVLSLLLLSYVIAFMDKLFLEWKI